MLDGINSNIQIQNANSYKPKKIPTQNNTITSPIDSYTMAGLESLGVYNMNLVKQKEVFDHKPAELILPLHTKIDDIEGEKVLNPYGKLEYIVKNDGQYETRYYPNDRNNANEVDRIEIRDVYSGKLLKKQDNEFVTEYPTDEPNVQYTTFRYDNKVEDIIKEETLPNGLTKTYHKYLSYQKPQLSIALSSKNNDNSIEVSFDSNDVVKQIAVEKEVGNNRYFKTINLNKGAVININENKTTTVPNYMEREVLNDNDVMPTEKFDKKKIEALAKNSPSNIYSFNGDGSLKELKDDNIKIEFNEDGSQNIIEYINKDITKITKYDKDDSIEVHYQNGDIKKYLSITSDNNPEFYSIYQGDKAVRTASFSKEGYLQWS